MRAIVLGGGGTKGSYEIGAFKALRELNISYHIVTGSSVGALNGAFFATGDYKRATQLWDTITIDDVIDTENTKENNVQKLCNKGANLPVLIKDYLLHGPFDITPLKNLLQKNIDLDLLQMTSCKLGIITVEIPSLKPQKIIINELEKKQMLPYLIASASCFPVFPFEKIDTKKYIDGGYYDNLPIDFAKQLGADEIIAIDLHDQNKKRKQYLEDPKVHYIAPSVSLGSFLHFSPKQIKNNKALGYLDTLKHFHKLDGIHYAFKKERNDNLKDLSYHFCNLLSTVKEMHSICYQTFLHEQLKDISTTLEECQLFFLKGLEICMEIEQYSFYQAYHIQNILSELLTHPIMKETERERNCYQTIEKVQEFYAKIKQKGQTEIIKFILHLLRNNRTSCSLMHHILSFFQDLSIAALFLFTIEQKHFMIS